MANDSATFGSVISDKRKTMGLSQRELANRIKKENGDPISPQYLNDLERDRRNPPSEHLLWEFARVLNLKFEQLVYLAGQIPTDLQGINAPPEQIELAFAAFRRTIKGTNQ